MKYFLVVNVISACGKVLCSDISRIESWYYKMISSPGYEIPAILADYGYRFRHHSLITGNRITTEVTTFTEE